MTASFLGWHEENFEIFPVGEGYEWEVHEFDFKKQGEEIYNKNGVRIIHWPTIHVSDGASSYRLDWNGLSFCYTGDNRPNKLAIKYCEGVDMYVSETYTRYWESRQRRLGCYRLLLDGHMIITTPQPMR